MKNKCDFNEANIRVEIINPFFIGFHDNLMRYYFLATTVKYSIWLRIKYVQLFIFLIWCGLGLWVRALNHFHQYFSNSVAVNLIVGRNRRNF